jgi:hypothetical protein
MVLPGYNTSPIVEPGQPLRDYEMTALGHVAEAHGQQRGTEEET